MFAYQFFSKEGLVLKHFFYKFLKINLRWLTVLTNLAAAYLVCKKKHFIGLNEDLTAKLLSTFTAMSMFIFFFFKKFWRDYWTEKLFSVQLALLVIFWKWEGKGSKVGSTAKKEK